MRARNRRSLLVGVGIAALGACAADGSGDARPAAQFSASSIRDRAVPAPRLYHGNYCGRGDNGADVTPVDVLDGLCMKHDRCWDARGDFSCSCDKAFLAKAVALANDARLSYELRRKAGAVAAAISALVCDKL